MQNRSVWFPDRIVFATHLEFPGTTAIEIVFGVVGFRYAVLQPSYVGSDALNCSISVIETAGSCRQRCLR